MVDYAIVDGNREKDPLKKILDYLKTNEFGFFALTVMPGPQLRQAIPFTKLIHEEFPKIFIREGKVVKTKKGTLHDQDSLMPLPYDKLNSFYPMDSFLGKTFLGTKTIAYHSSIGCPFTCSFCGVVPIFEARWKGKSAGLIYKDIKFLKEKYGANAFQFHDNNFFVSEKRSVEFARLAAPEGAGPAQLRPLRDHRRRGGVGRCGRRPPVDVDVVIVTGTKLGMFGMVAQQ